MGDTIYHIQDLFFSNIKLCVMGSEVLRNLLGTIGFISLFFIKSDSKGVNRSARILLRNRCDKS